MNAYTENAPGDLFNKSTNVCFPAASISLMLGIVLCA